MQKSKNSLRWEEIATKLTTKKISPQCRTSLDCKKRSTLHDQLNHFVGVAEIQKTFRWEELQVRVTINSERNKSEVR
jgi:hypothetical protein